MILKNRDYIYKIKLSVFEYDMLNYKNDLVVGTSCEFVKMIPLF